ncbi:hypothetical protein BP5796_01156 [Coleophoma crateriformis]|uniref:Glutathione S-transferase n=1 Tax=Coleophoma crateriformis TaxID=565419 RepID=A0A3D8SZM1_9HELO|nr:hypothetical protein BP5796_01156 [Coleophoma crateriformis]
MASLRLYTLDQSGNSYKVRLLAALLGITLELIEVDMANDELHSPEFLAMNPRAQIPVLVVGDKTFTDSAAILVYLAGSYPDVGSTKTPSSFWSNDIAEQAAIVDWLAFATGWIHNGVSGARKVLNFPAKGFSMNDPLGPPTLETATAVGYKSLAMLQTRLCTNEWLALGRPTIADIAVFVYVALAHMGNISLDPYPAVKSWISRFKDLPGFIPMIGIDGPKH